MKLLFDQNISSKVLKKIPDIFDKSSHVKFELLINNPDKIIWDYAKHHGFTIVTQDSDFNELNILYGHPPKIIWIRTGNIKTELLQNILFNYSREIASFIENANYGCFEIFSIKK